MREMRRKGQQLSPEECRTILQEGSSGVLAVSGDDGYPYAVPLSYALWDGRIVFHCAPAGHKMDAVSRSEKASFCVIGLDRVLPEKFTTVYRSVIVFGRIRRLKDREEIVSALRALGSKYSPGVPGLEEEIASSLYRVAVLALTPETVTGKEGIELTRARRRDTPGEPSAECRIFPVKD